MARCPAHDDRNPTLSITAAEDGRALVHCFAGCLTEDVVAKVGMCLADLFPDRIAPYDLSARDLRTTLETIGPASLAVKSARSNGHGPGRRLLMTKVSDVKAEAVRWLWQGRVVLGMLNVVVGEPGLGKSTLAYDLAAKLSRGALEGDLYGEPSDALVVTYEDHVASVVRPRLEAAGADVTRVRVIGVRQEDDSEGLLSLPADLDLIRDAIERTGARLLIVDPIVASLAGEINSHRDQDVRRVLAPLAQMAERYDIAVAAVMHVNKSTAKQFFQRVGGSIGFTGAARSMLLVARDPDDPDGERAGGGSLRTASATSGRSRRRCCSSLSRCGYPATSRHPSSTRWGNARRRLRICLAPTAQMIGLRSTRPSSSSKRSLRTASGRRKRSPRRPRQEVSLNGL